MSQLSELLKNLQGSDLHIAPDSHPMVRQNRQIHAFSDRPLTQQACLEMGQELLSGLSKKQQKELSESNELLFIYQGQQKDRYRVYLYWKDDHIKIHFRFLPDLIPNIEDLGLPQNITEIAKYTDGLILIAGHTSSGRSTTAYSLIRHWNNTRSIHLITLERVLEHLISSHKSLIYQRQIHDHWQFYTEGLLKQDIDACFVADVCEPHGYDNLIDLCKGGGLVLSTLFASSTVNAIEQFLSDSDKTIANHLSHYLRAIIYQRLLPSKSGQPVLIAEILLPTPEIRQLIQKQDLNPIYHLIKKDQHRTGMTSFNQSLMNALIKRKIELRTAFANSHDPNELDQLLKKVGI